MVRTAIIMGMVGHLDDDTSRTIARVGDAGYSGIELGVESVDDESTTVALDKAGLNVTSIMTGLDQIQSPKEGLLSACRTLDCNRVVLGWLDETYYESPEATKNTAAILNECVAGLADHGLTLCYHNHDHEFVTFDDAEGRSAFEVLVDNLDDRVQFEFDVGWVGTAGVDPVEVIETYADRTPLIHLKDMVYQTGESVQLGDGDLNVEEVVKAATDADVEWLIYEHEYPEDAEVSMRETAPTMNELVRKFEGGAE